MGNEKHKNTISGAERKVTRRRDEESRLKRGRLLKILFENQQSVSLNITFNIQFE